MIPISSFAWDQRPNQPIASCLAEIPYGMPIVGDPNNDVIECHTAYALAFNKVAKIPDWVAYTLTPEHAIGCLARHNLFVTDNILEPGKRSEPSDYVDSGYDKGHLANDADMSWNQQVQNESFLMSNISPQTPATNRGIWKVLETAVRAWTYDNNVPYTIYTGNIYTPDSNTIGDDKVVVPDYLYKIVINDNTKQIQAYIIPNSMADQGKDLKPFLTNIAEIEKATGITFPIPGNADKSTIASNPWPIDLRKLDGDKKKLCHVTK
jgi:endonuclease G